MANLSSSFFFLLCSSNCLCCSSLSRFLALSSSLFLSLPLFLLLLPLQCRLPSSSFSSSSSSFYSLLLSTLEGDVAWRACQWCFPQAISSDVRPLRILHKTTINNTTRVLTRLFPKDTVPFGRSNVPFGRSNVPSRSAPKPTIYPLGPPQDQHMWQSCVEIESYFVMYFDRIAVFEVPYR